MVGMLLLLGMAVLVGVPVLHAATTINQSSINDQMQAQAFYLAEAGIQEARQVVIYKAENGKLLLNQPTDQVIADVSGELVTGRYNAVATLTPDNKVVIAAYGYAGSIASAGGGFTATATADTCLEFSLTPEEGGGGTGGGGSGSAGQSVDVALFARDSIRMDSSPTTIGDVITNATGNDMVYFGNNTVRIQGKLSIGQGGNPATVVDWPWGVAHSTIVSGGEPAPQATNRNYPVLDFPAVPSNLPTRSNINLDRPNPRAATISADGYYQSVRMNGGSSSDPAVLTIDAPSGTTRVLRFGSWEFNNESRVVINGTGKVTVYVDSNLDFRNQLLINSGGSVDQLTIYCNGNYVQFTNGALFKGYLFCRSAGININSNAQIIGCVATGGGDVQISRNGSREHQMLLYAPNSYVAVNSGSVINGAVVCRAYYMTNTCVLRYDSSVKYLLGGSGGGTPLQLGGAVWTPNK